MPTAKTARQPRKEAKQMRAVRTVDGILKAAARILKRDGPAKLTTNHIAQEANLSVGSIYQYFPNKEAILIKLMSLQLEQAMAVRPLELDQTSTLEEHVRTAVRWHLQVRQKDPQLFQRLAEIQQDVLTHEERVWFEAYHQSFVRRGLEKYAADICIQDLDTACLVVSHFILAATQSATASDPSLIGNRSYEAEIVAGLLAYLTGGR